MTKRSKNQARKSVVRHLKVKVKKADIVHEEISLKNSNENQVVSLFMCDGSHVGMVA
ncbi:hypothetical protein RHMOL_Rhmol12G0121800 [Rhododendron molle]|uniref:Uncharacterized protein n=1 Tax=Rhododendron molle TaxID=49168 RepID=A0ACC0LHH1_RHOML|nr:hypothetical protein RHMOL_Rhmol12G0121800 [Rhododendron molle]